jgi:hypothetical protein
MKSFATWLYKKFGEPELLDIARYKSGIKAHLPIDREGNVDYTDSLKKLDFLQWCHSVSTCEYFGPFIGALLKAQEVEIVENVATEQSLRNARAARHGVNIVREQFEIQAEKYIALTAEEKEDYNTFEVI